MPNQILVSFFMGKEMIHALGKQTKSGKSSVYHSVVSRWLSDELLVNNTFEDFQSHSEKILIMNNEIKKKGFPLHKTDCDKQDYIIIGNNITV